jgi:hypothetical protein
MSVILFLLKVHYLLFFVLIVLAINNVYVSVFVTASVVYVIEFSANRLSATFRKNASIVYSAIWVIGMVSLYFSRADYGGLINLLVMLLIWIVFITQLRKPGIIKLIIAATLLTIATVLIAIDFSVQALVVGFALGIACLIPILAPGKYLDQIIISLRLLGVLLILLLKASIFYFSCNGESVDLIVNQKNVEMLFTIPDVDEIAGLGRKSQIRYFIKGCDNETFYLSGLYALPPRNQFLAAWNPKTGSLINSNIKPYEGLDINCITEELYVGSDENLLIYSVVGGSLAIKDSVAIGVSSLRQIKSVRDGSLIYMISDMLFHSNKFIIIRRGDLKQIYRKSVELGTQFEAHGSEIVLLDRTEFKHFIVDEANGSVRLNNRWSVDHEGGVTEFEVDFDKKLLFLPNYYNGELNIYDLVSGRKINGVFLAEGTRYTEYISEANLLIILNYLNGKLSILDATELRVIDELIIGKGGRKIMLSPDRKSVFVTTTTGVFKVDLSDYLSPEKQL